MGEARRGLGGCPHVASLSYPPSNPLRWRYTMPPITIVFFLTGLAVWAIGLYFVGVGAQPREGGPNPLVSVGWLSLIAGLSDFGQAFYIMAARPEPLGADGSVLISGLIIFYATFFTLLGITAIKGLDLRVIGNVALPVAIVPLFYWNVFAGGWMFRSILIVWLIAFLAVWATTYGRFSAKLLGWILLFTAVYTFWIPGILLALGRSIP